jgi:replicative DNA helicase
MVKERTRRSGKAERQAPPETLDGRPLPADLELEKDTLSACLRDHVAFLRIRPMLKAETFHGEQHQIIWEGMEGLAAEGRPVNLSSVRSKLHAAGTLERAGGAAYLSDLFLNRGVPDDVPDYARRLQQQAKLRALIALGLRVAAVGRSAADRVDEFGEETQRELNGILYSDRGDGERLQHVGPTVDTSVAGVQQRYENGGAVSGVATGFTALDAQTGGIHDGDLWYVAARPGMGKTSALLGMVSSIVAPFESEPAIDVPEYGVALFSLEMPREQNVGRLICMDKDARIPFDRWRSGRLRDMDWGPAYAAAEKLKTSRLWIDDTPNISLPEAEAKLISLKSEWDRKPTFAGCPVCTHPLFYQAEIGRWYCSACTPDPRAALATLHARRTQLTRERRVAVALFDYIGLMRGSPDANSREEEIGGVSRGCKTLAKRLKMGVVAAAQLNRAVEQRVAKERMPQLSDLRDTGSLEQDADLILFLYRAAYYRPNDEKVRGRAVWGVAKQRNGSTGEIKMRYEESCSRFYDEDDLPPGL